MKEGDLVLHHVGNQNKEDANGIYVYGMIVKGIYILKTSPEDYCGDKNTCDMRIEHTCYGTPLILHEDVKLYTN